MASRESQGLQVALILFVMVTVVLAVTTYLYFRKAEEKVQMAEAAQEEAKRATSMYNSADFKNQIYRHLLGYDTKAQDQLNSMLQSLSGEDRTAMEETLKNFDDEMKLYGVGFTGEALNYRTLPAHLVAVVNTRNKQLAEADLRQRELEREREQVRQTEGARAAKAEAELAKARQDLQDERRKFQEDRDRIVTESKQVAAALPKVRADLARISTDAEQTKRQMEGELNRAQQVIDFQREKLDAQKETTFETADGRITWVNQRSGTVWIDLGGADGLERQMTFSVYDRDQTGVTSAPIKGRIEVTRILDNRAAEARILQDDLSNPILVDDIIYSPSFRRGQRTHFALAGLLDINGDGRSDQEKVKSIIRLNNGVIDCELKEDGTIEGKLSSTTRYLVRGKAPTDRTNERLTKGYSEIVGEATRLGIETIELSTLLDRMGYHDDARVVTMQRGGGALAPEEGVESTGFRKRQPGN
jgi:hypothetical protein